ncbi:hypothetical protein [Desulfogranum mediterraneum]|uniref:hypothetical protein n=1 Tax=Desulfogranum mediterraneum TaxID=160661 RepID=UPI00048C3E04|nr:hypothetical protein [Desulfogranum mediterraneum]
MTEADQCGTIKLGTLFDNTETRIRARHRGLLKKLPAKTEDPIELIRGDQSGKADRAQIELLWQV